MLHRRTYDTLSDTGTVIDWNLSPTGGRVVVQNSPTLFSLYLERWDETIEFVTHVDLEPHGATANTFHEAQIVASNIFSTVPA